MRKSADIIASAAALGLCGAAGAVGMLAPGLAAMAAASLISGAATAIWPNFANNLLTQIADRIKNKADPLAAAKNHELRALVRTSISNVLDEFARQTKPTSDLVKRLTTLKSEIPERLQRVQDDRRFAEVAEENLVPTYFRQQADEFIHVRSLTPELWEVFIGVDDTTTDPLERAALKAAAAALHRDLPRYLVGTYRDALRSDPRVFVAVTTEIQKAIWAVARRTEENTDQIKVQLNAISALIAQEHPQEIREELKYLQVIGDTLEWLTRETLEIVQQISKGVSNLGERMEAMANATARIAAGLSPDVERLKKLEDDLRSHDPRIPSLRVLSPTQWALRPCRARVGKGAKQEKSESRSV